MTTLAQFAAARRAPALAVGAVLGATLLAMGMIEWGSAWYFPVDGRSLFTITRPLGAQYRILLWGVIVASVLAALLQGRIGPAFRAFAPLAPFLGVAVVAGVLGDQPSTSAWYIAQWMVMAVAALSVGLLASLPVIQRTGLWVFGAVLVASLALYLLVPSAGSMHVNGRGGLLRGFFPGKQFSGWFAAVAIIWCVSFREGRPDARRLAVIGVALVVLVRAASAGAVSTLAAGLAYWGVVRLLQLSPLSKGARAGVATAAAAGAGLAVFVGLPLVLQFFGRDPTLTGRTVLWGMYWRFMQDNELIGRGPGAFAMGSPIAFSIAPHLESDFVVSTHNMYLTMFGDTGFLGAGLYVAGLAWIAFVSPFVRPGPDTTTAAVLAAMILAAGFTEARDTLTPGLASFLLLALRTASLLRPAETRRTRRARPIPRRPGGRAVGSPTRPAARPSIGPLNPV